MMNVVTMMFTIVLLAEIIIIYLIDNPENYNFKIFTLLLLQGVCIYKLEKSYEKIIKLEKIVNCKKYKI